MSASNRKPFDHNSTAQQYDNIENIQSRKPQRIHSVPQKFSKAIKTAKSLDNIDCVCEVTGIVSILSVPYIPSVVLSYVHPLALLPNARGIAQQGISYLRSLDIQVLAGILIVLAEDYDLFRYTPSMTGANKNAVLRTVGKDILIDAIIFIEERVNSANSRFFPALSFLFDGDDLQRQNMIQARMVEWLKTCAERFYQPDTRSYEESVTIRKSIKPQYSSIKRKQASAAKKEFRAWAKATKPAIATLYSKNLISAKLKTFLQALLDESNLMNADGGMVDLIVQKLNQVNSEVAPRIGIALADFRDKLLSTEEQYDWDEVESFSSQPVGSSLSTSSNLQPSISEESESQEQAEGQRPEPSIPSIPSPDSKGPVSFLERMKAIRAAKASIIAPTSTPQQAADSSKGDEDAPF